MPRRRQPSQLDQTLERYGLTVSGGKVGVLRHFLDANGNPTPEYYRFRALQRIGTKDPKSRAKAERRFNRESRRHNREHAFLKGERFQIFPDWYADNPSRRDALTELEESYWSGEFGYLNGRPLSLIAEDLHGFRRDSKEFRRHFEDYEIDHVINNLTLRALRESKLLSR